jgi:hypothetical protein
MALVLVGVYCVRLKGTRYRVHCAVAILVLVLAVFASWDVCGEASLVAAVSRALDIVDVGIDITAVLQRWSLTRPAPTAGVPVALATIVSTVANVAYPTRLTGATSAYTALTAANSAIMNHARRSVNFGATRTNKDACHKHAVASVKAVDLEVRGFLSLCKNNRVRVLVEGMWEARKPDLGYTGICIAGMELVAKRAQSEDAVPHQRTRAAVAAKRFQSSMARTAYIQLRVNSWATRTQIWALVFGSDVPFWDLEYWLHMLVFNTCFVDTCATLAMIGLLGTSLCSCNRWARSTNRAAALLVPLVFFVLTVSLWCTCTLMTPSRYIRDEVRACLVHGGQVGCLGDVSLEDSVTTRAHLVSDYDALATLKFQVAKLPYDAGSDNHVHAVVVFDAEMTSVSDANVDATSNHIKLCAVVVWISLLGGLCALHQRWVGETPQRDLFAMPSHLYTRHR